MIRFLCSAFLLVISARIFGQATPPPPISEAANTGNEAVPVPSFAEQKAEFPGGEAGLIKFISENVRYPKDEKNRGIQGLVIIMFIIDKEGKPGNIKVYKGITNGPGLEKEALRVVSMMPMWKPGIVNGKKVSGMYNLPIAFSLRKHKRK
jgi:protein TonB